MTGVDANEPVSPPPRYPDPSGRGGPPGYRPNPQTPASRQFPPGFPQVLSCEFEFFISFVLLIVLLIFEYSNMVDRIVVHLLDRIIVQINQSSLRSKKKVDFLVKLNHFLVLMKHRTKPLNQINDD